MKKLTTLNDVMAALPENRRREIEAKADVEIREIHALRSATRDAARDGTNAAGRQNRHGFD